jgi:hypothetical protein
MDFVHSADKNRRNTGGILSIFAKPMREIGGVCSGKALISASLNIVQRAFTA